MLRVFARGIRRMAMSESHSADPFVIVKPGCRGCMKAVKKLTFGAAESAAAAEPVLGSSYRVKREGEAGVEGATGVRKPNPLKMCF